MLEISSDFIGDLCMTGIDFYKDTQMIQIRRNGVWVSLEYDDCTIWVWSTGCGSVRLYRVPVDFDFDFDNALRKNTFAIQGLGVFSDLWVIEGVTPFKKVVEQLRKRKT